MRFAVEVASPPSAAARVVDLATAKAHARIDIDDDDALLDIYQLAAIGLIEQRTGIKVLAQAVRVVFDAFYGREIQLPIAPVRSVDSIEYTAADGSTQSVDEAAYSVVIAPLSVRIQAVDSWPATTGRIGAVAVECAAGWTAATMPSGIKLAVLLLLGHWYISREAVGTVSDEVELAFEALVQPYRLQFPT